MSNRIFEIEFITQEIDSNQQLTYKKSRKEKGTLIRSVYEEKKIIWNICKYNGKIKYDGTDWQYQSSSMQLNEQLTVIKIVEKLNFKNLFDFEYLPEENDFLKLRNEYVYKQIKNRSRPFINIYISFIFMNGKWNINEGYDHIMNDYIDYKQGITKYVA